MVVICTLSRRVSYSGGWRSTTNRFRDSIPRIKHHLRDCWHSIRIFVMESSWPISCSPTLEPTPSNSSRVWNQNVSSMRSISPTPLRCSKLSKNSISKLHSSWRTSHSPVVGRWFSSSCIYSTPSPTTYLKALPSYSSVYWGKIVWGTWNSKIPHQKP